MAMNRAMLEMLKAVAVDPSQLKPTDKPGSAGKVSPPGIASPPPSLPETVPSGSGTVYPPPQVPPASAAEADAINEAAIQKALEFIQMSEDRLRPPPDQFVPPATADNIPLPPDVPQRPPMDWVPEGLQGFQDLKVPVAEPPTLDAATDPVVPPAEPHPLMGRLQELRDQERDQLTKGMVANMLGQSANNLNFNRAQRLLGGSAPEYQPLPLVSPAAIERQGLLEEYGIQQQVDADDPMSEESQSWRNILASVGVDLGNVSASQAQRSIPLIAAAMRGSGSGGKELKAMPAEAAKVLAGTRNLAESVQDVRDAYEKAKHKLGPWASRWDKWKGKITGSQDPDLRRLDIALNRLNQENALILTGQQATDRLMARLEELISRSCVRRS